MMDADAVSETKVEKLLVAGSFLSCKAVE